VTQWGLDTIFNPGKRHMDEEKLRLQSTREEIGDSSGGRRIDLESGRVTIRKAKTAAETDEAEDTAEDTAEDADEDTAEDAAEDAAEEDPAE
jgi:hypothetical protein